MKTLNRPLPVNDINHGAPGQHQIRPFVSDTGIGGKLVAGFCPQTGDNLMRLAGLNGDAVNLFAVIALQAKMHSSQSCNRAGCANKLHIANIFNRMLARHELGQMTLRVIHHLLIAMPVFALSGVALGQAHNTKRQGRTVSRHKTPARLACQPYDFRAAAANVKNKNMARLLIKKRSATHSGQLGLLIAVNNFQRQAGFAAHTGDKISSIIRFAAGFRGNTSDAGHTGAAYFRRANPQSANGSHNRGLRQASGCIQPLPQTHNTRKAVTHSEPAMRRLDNQQAAIICAEINGGIKRFSALSQRPKSGFAARRAGAPRFILTIL